MQRIDPERPAGRDIDVGGPQIEVLPQIASYVYVALARVNERLSGLGPF